MVVHGRTPARPRVSTIGNSHTATHAPVDLPGCNSGCSSTPYGRSQGRPSRDIEGDLVAAQAGQVNFAAADVDSLVRIVKRKLEKIQYRPHLIESCLAGTGLFLGP